MDGTKPVIFCPDGGTCLEAAIQAIAEGAPLEYLPLVLKPEKQLNVVIIKVEPMPHYTDSYNNRYALPGEQNPG
ncbi:MAG: hypothetical protein K2X78_10190 [Burkholderiaceae bacterium]|nr:hypothetical protein [Burkholderiaceae bacterium]